MLADSSLDIRVVSSQRDIEDCFEIRHRVFVLEQNVSVELERDEFENISTHFLGCRGGIAVAAARSRQIENSVKIQRLAVLKSYRGCGYGRQMMEYMLTSVEPSSGIDQFVLDAQSQALAFYQSLGFEVEGGEFIDAGIPHVKMVLDRAF